MPRAILGAVLLALPFSALAQTPPAPPSAMSFDQWAARARDRLMALDADHDGKISKEEFAAGQAMMMMGRGRMPADGDGAAPKRDGSRMFALLDTNNDGVIDATEINAMLARRFARMDANHDGVLTPDERQAMRGRDAPEQ